MPLIVAYTVHIMHSIAIVFVHVIMDMNTNMKKKIYMKNILNTQKMDVKMSVAILTDNFALLCSV